MRQRTTAGSRQAAFGRMRCLLVPCVFSACDACEPQLPVAVASSRYIEYHTWMYPDGLVDDAVVCMDDKLASMDRFIEFVAETLELDVPATPIHYVWTPRALLSEDTWICPAGAVGCFDSDGPGGRKVVYSTELDLSHELVHAVEIPALGQSHPVFEEGMANYLSTAWSSADILPEFPATLKAGIGPGRHPGGEVSMHFVGALLARSSMAQYVELRSRVGHDDGLTRSRRPTRTCLARPSMSSSRTRPRTPSSGSALIHFALGHLHSYGKARARSTRRSLGLAVTARRSGSARRFRRPSHSTSSEKDMLA